VVLAQREDKVKKLIRKFNDIHIQIIDEIPKYVYEYFSSKEYLDKFYNSFFFDIENKLLEDIKSTYFINCVELKKIKKSDIIDAVQCELEPTIDDNLYLDIIELLENLLEPLEEIFSISTSTNENFNNFYEEYIHEVYLDLCPIIVEKIMRRFIKKDLKELHKIMKEKM
jgi:hypothetical protein